MAKYAQGIYKRGRIFWICYKNRDNKIVRESAKTDDLATAESLLAFRRRTVASGEGCREEVCNPCTFMELAEKYCEFAASQKSFYIKKIIINQLVERFGGIDLGEFEPSLVQSYLSEGLEGGLKPATVNRRLACLKHMFRKAYEWGHCSEGRLKQIRKVKFLRENNQRVRYLELEECQALVQVCEKYPRLRHLKPIIITAMNTGMRRSEVLALKWDQLDFKSGLIKLCGGSGGQERQIPINDVLAEVFRKIVRRLDSPYVFVDSQGKPYKHIREAFASACRRIGVKDFRFQDLRHTFASHLVIAGIEISTVSKLLGHKSTAMTLRYSYLAPDHMKAAVNALNGLTTKPAPFRMNDSSSPISTKNGFSHVA